MKSSLIAGVIGIIVCAPYYVRNYVLFGGLIFPKIPHRAIHFTKSFEFTNPDYSQQLTVAYQESSGIIDYMREMYWDFWGIPTGNLSKVAFLPNYIVMGFMLMTLVISLFYIFGVLRGVRDRKNLITYVWLLTWAIAILLTGKNLLWGYRRLLPTAPFLALLAGYGFNDLLDMSSRHKQVLTKMLYVVLILAIIGCSASQMGKAYVANEYFDKYSDSLYYLKTIPGDPIVTTPYQEQTLYYSEKKSYMLPQLEPSRLSHATLREHNISYIVRADIYMFYDMTPYNERIDQMASQGLLKLEKEFQNVKIYEVV
ncbi:MAG: hypothetical protein QMC85_07295 [Methanocellales archaeon]|nr:hypothetical protein [Methanocellales archaeon]